MRYEQFVGLLQEKGFNQGVGTKSFRCPSHADRLASLSVSRKADNGVLIFCFAGCSPYEVVTALGLRISDLQGAAPWPRARTGPSLTNPPPSVVSPKPSKPPRPGLDGGMLWPTLAEITPAGPVSRYLESRGLHAGPVREVPFNHSTPWLRRKAGEGYRLAMPLVDAAGKIIDFQIRNIDPSFKGVTKLSLPGPRPRPAAFPVNSSFSRRPLHVVAEGIADSLALRQVGAWGFGAPGIARVKDLAEMLPAGLGRVYLCAQNDKGGQSQKAFSALFRALELAGRDCRVVLPPWGYKDYAEALGRAGVESFRAAMDDVFESAK